MKRFAGSVAKSAFSVGEPLVKIRTRSPGGHVIFGSEGAEGQENNLAYLGKIVESCSGKNFLGSDAWLDLSFPHVIYITGTRGSGKSFDLGILIEGLSKLRDVSPVQHGVDPACTILIDTQSQFWSLAYPPSENIPEHKRQLSELAKWELSPTAIENIRLFIPHGTERVTGTETEFRLRPNQLTLEDWCTLVGQEIYSAQGHILGVTMEAIGSTNFSIQDIIDFIADDTNWSNVPEQSRQSLLYKLDNYRRSGLFGPDGFDVDELLVPGQCNVFMLRDLANQDKSLVTAIIARQLFLRLGKSNQKRRASAYFGSDEGDAKLPSKVWLLIDEAHVVAPSNSPSPARGALVEYVKRGRDSGLSLVLATQQPSAVDDQILSQVNLSFSHRLTFGQDISSAEARIPTKTISSAKMGASDVKGFGDVLRLLGPGQAFVGDSHSSRVVLVQMRPRVTAHGGYSPT